MPTTDTYWSIGGVDLHTFAKSIETMGGLDIPPQRRGEDTTIPYRLGEVDELGVIGSRTLTLKMWVRGVNDDGSAVANPRNKYWDNWRALRNLLWNEGKSFFLTKRFLVGGVVKTATAIAKYEGGLETEMFGRSMSKFTVDLKLMDPYFYGDVALTPVLANGNQNITVEGDATTYNVSIAFFGIRTNPKVRNNTLNIDVEYHDALATGDVTVVDVLNFRSWTTPSGSPQYDSEEKIIHTGDSYWMAFKPGLNVINLSSSAGIGAVGLSIREAWL